MPFQLLLLSLSVFLGSGRGLAIEDISCRIDQMQKNAKCKCKCKCIYIYIYVYLHIWGCFLLDACRNCLDGATSICESCWAILSVRMCFRRPPLFAMPTPKMCVALYYSYVQYNKRRKRRVFMGTGTTGDLLVHDILAILVAVAKCICAGSCLWLLYTVTFTAADM